MDEPIEHATFERSPSVAFRSLVKLTGKRMSDLADAAANGTLAGMIVAANRRRELRALRFPEIAYRRRELERLRDIERR